MRTLRLTCVIFVFPWLSSFQPVKTLFKTIGGTKIFDVESNGVYIFTAGMMIDADGSPRAYHKDRTKGLDFLGNAGKPGNWWALATDNKKANGNPLVQQPDDPAPGFYISMTSLQDESKKYADPTRYVNSETIPFIVIPPKFSANFKLGDIALAVNTKNNKRCFAIVADIGPMNKIGEGSINLANQLGLRSNPKFGGAENGITYILIKNSGNGKVMTTTEIENIGKEQLTDSVIVELLK